jgi:hypothetical protein
MARSFSRPSGVRLLCGEDLDEDAREDEFILVSSRQFGPI